MRVNDDRIIFFFWWTVKSKATQTAACAQSNQNEPLSEEVYLHAAPDKPQGILSATSLSSSGPGGIQLYRASPYSTFWVNCRSGSWCIIEFDLSMLTAFLIYWLLLIRRREVYSGKMTQLQASTICPLFWHMSHVNQSIISLSRASDALNY